MAEKPSLRRQLEELIYGYADKLKKARLAGSYVYGGDYDRFKYRLARIVADKLLSTSCAGRIYYADLASGEFITQQQYYGRDVDILVVTRGGRCSEEIQRLAQELENRVNTIVAAIASQRGIDWLAHVARTNGILEIHVDDKYAQATRRKELKGLLSDTNAIPLQ